MPTITPEGWMIHIISPEPNSGLTVELVAPLGSNEDTEKTVAWLYYENKHPMIEVYNNPNAPFDYYPIAELLGAIDSAKRVLINEIIPYD